MKVFLSATEFDLDGFVEIEPLPDSEYGPYARRSTRTPTLDGGVVSQDYGFSHGDRVMSIKFESTQALDATLKHLVEQYSLVQVSADGGVFTAMPEYRFAPDVSTLYLQLTESLV